MKAFALLFDTEDPKGLSGTQTVEFDVNRFKIFLSSWMQELRHIHASEDKQRYLNELLAKFSEKDHEHCFWYHGQRKNPTKKLTYDLTNDFQQPRGLTLT